MSFGVVPPLNKRASLNYLFIYGMNCPIWWKLYPKTDHKIVDLTKNRIDTSLFMLLANNRLCYRASYNALFWNSKTNSVNDSICNFYRAFQGNPVQNLHWGNVGKILYYSYQKHYIQECWMWTDQWWHSSEERAAPRPPDLMTAELLP